jgi:hypothetical protein
MTPNTAALCLKRFSANAFTCGALLSITLHTILIIDEDFYLAHTRQLSLFSISGRL